MNFQYDSHKKINKNKHCIQERPLCGLLANINNTAANMGQSVICVWDGWAFVWQEGLRNRAADNTWVLSWGLGEWPGSQRERQRGHHSPLRQPSVGWEGRFTAGTEDTSLFCSPVDGLWRKQFYTLLTECMASRLRCYLRSTPGETTEYSHHLLLLTNEQLNGWSLKASFSDGRLNKPHSQVT